MRKLAITFGCLALAAATLAGCSGDSGAGSNKKALRDQALSKTTQRPASNIYYSLPSPLEVASIVQATGVEYDSRVLHKTELGVRYSTNMAAAVNLGIYGADFSYSIYFDQKQVALKYLDCIKNLASGLDISDILTQRKLKELEENISDKEKLKKIVSQTFFHSDALLKENSRKPTAMMIVMGMWVESINISARLCKGDPEYNHELAKSIVEQGLVFDDLMGMLNGLGNSPDVAHIKAELDPLRNSYAAMNASLGGSYVSADGSSVAYDKELFQSICKSVTDARDNFTQLF